MHPRLLLIFVTLVLAMCGAALYFGPPHASTDPGSTMGRERQAAPIPGSLSESLVDPTAMGNRAEQTARPSDDVLVAPSAASEPPALGLVIHGTVRFSGDRALAGGAEFLLDHGSELTRVKADANGAFRIDQGVRAGVVEMRHRPSAPGGAYPMRLVFEPASVVIAGAAGDEVTLDLTLLRPAAILTVDVVHVDGSAAAGATVEFEQVIEGAPGSRSHSLDSATTSKKGRASFALYHPDETRVAGLIARLETGSGASILTSALTRLDVPFHLAALDEPQRLTLAEAGSIVVRVADANDRPSPGQRIIVQPNPDDLQWWTGANPVTDENGEATIHGLPPGAYTVSIFRGVGLPREDVTVDAGQRHDVAFVLPVTSVALAVSGRVVDEQGEGLSGVTLSARMGPTEGPATSSASCSTDEDGYFSVDAEPTETVSITPSRGVFADLYGPRDQVVPFGATDLLFERVGTTALENVDFEIVDARTGELIPGALVMTYRAPDLGDYAFHRAADGRATPRCPVHSATTLVIEASGYRRATVPLADLLEDPPDGNVHRVALDPGLLRTVRVEIDAGTGDTTRAHGARISDGSRLLGVTDAQGEFVVDVFTWPEAGLMIEADGCEPQTWDPADSFADLEPAWIELTLR